VDFVLRCESFYLCDQFKRMKGLRKDFQLVPLVKRQAAQFSDAGLTRKQDDTAEWKHVSQRFRELKAVHVGHDDVGDDEVWGRLATELQESSWVAEWDGFKSFYAEDLRGRDGDCFFVVHYKYAKGNCVLVQMQTLLQK
jgi:hypothetical protein